MSPLHALLSRLVISDKNEADVHAQFGRLVWGDAAQTVTDKTVWKAKASTVLELSGVPKFEEHVLGFLHKNSESLKLMSLLDESIKILQVSIYLLSAM